MPELAEVEIARRNLQRWWKGHAVSQAHVWDDALLENATATNMRDALRTPLDRVARRGKYLMAHLDDGRVVVFHFRMTGKIVVCDQPEPDYARLSWLVDDVGWLVFKDPRRLGRAVLLKPGELDDYEPIAKLGPEPFGLTPAKLRDILPERRQLKAALMDQSVIAGVGNIAVTEIFWRLKLAPRVQVGDLTDQQMAALADELPNYFSKLIAKSDADDITYVNQGGDNPFDVYARAGEPCPRCGTAIERTRVGGRSTYFCPKCQEPGALPRATEHRDLS